MITTDEIILRTTCEAVDLSEVDTLVSQLELELQQSAERGFPGIGLAAPQIGISKRAAIIRLDEYKINLINAKIVKKFDQFVFDGEGCLSFPNRSEKTNRYNEIVVENEVAPKKFVATGLLAVAIQHELDHLDNILLPDIAIQEVKQKTKVRPNDKCPCGSGKKYKICCGK